jgi:hypothetical protein
MDTVSQLSAASVFVVEHLQRAVWHIKPTFREKTCFLHLQSIGIEMEAARSLKLVLIYTNLHGVTCQKFEPNNHSHDSLKSHKHALAEYITMNS